MKFTEDTLLVMETKATLGLSRTPGFNKTQAIGSQKINDVLNNIDENRRGWKIKNILEVDPHAMSKIDALNDARATGNIQYLHAQVFFDHAG